jgi:uncharacterized protein YjgD (DUF1641 family)
MEENMSILKELVKLADHFDKKGLHKESDVVDAIITRMASRPTWGLEPRDVLPGDEGDAPEASDEELAGFLVDDHRKWGEQSTLSSIIDGIEDLDLLMSVLDPEEVVKALKSKAGAKLIDYDKLLAMDGVAEMVQEELLRTAELNYSP